MDLTFLVTGDTHFGVEGIEARHGRIIDDMNRVAGRELPGANGRVGEPRGLLVAGDLTDGSGSEEWAQFVTFYGLNGRDGLLHYPVYEGIGNHDKLNGWYIKDRVKERHGAQRYAIDWDDVHVVCLGEAPDDEDIAWLRDDLARAGKDVGVVLYFHFPLRGPFSNTWFNEGAYPEHLREALKGYHVLGIFHGHYHASGSYRWHGIDAYLSGSAKHDWHSYTVVRITDTRMTVASWHYDLNKWWWWHDKPIFGAPGAEHRVLGANHRIARDEP
jgi:cytolysin (calcineurin-like family phosphatase)